MLSLNSCTHTFYVPNDNFMLQLKEKNDFTVSGGYLYNKRQVQDFGNIWPEEISSESGAQIGYSPFNHLAVAGSFAHSNNENMKQNNLRSQGKVWQAAIGSYLFIKSKHLPNPNKGLLIDAYLGYGTGNITTTFFARNGKSIINFQQYFFQTGIYYKITNLDVGINFKRSLLNYYDGNVFFEILPDDLNKIEAVLEETPYNLNQLSFRIATGFEKGKIFLNINNLFKLNETLRSTSPEASFGIHLDLNKILTKKKNN